ncbi:MAG: cadmium-translocating P-type ATPase [Rhodobiaceae bacterium]|nr:cadmium-translocating P-type ATPase [Rhodobiaceae bacterium]MCC0040892.1 cadmium-translocating P-type ATPase [Rhodobiaceae bacterium]
MTAETLVPPRTEPGALPSGGEHVTLDVDGMSCASCVARVEKALGGVTGVREANINLALARADVTLGAGEKVALERLIEAVRDAGYDARARGENAEERAAQREAAELETRARLRRDVLLLVVATVLTLPLVAPMAGMVLGLDWHLPVGVEAVLGTIVQFAVGRRFYVGAWKALRSRSATMDTLVALGTSAAWGFSLYLVLTRGEAARGHLYFEGAAVILTLVLFGKILEARAKASAGDAIRALAALRPQSAVVLEADGEREVPLSALRVGMQVLVVPGGRVPVDGTVISGASEMDEALVTGESAPVAKQAGSRVIEGAINGNGRLVIEVAAVGEDTTVARMIRMVEAAQAGKAPVQRLVDRIAGVFVPAVLGVAVLTFAGWMFAGGGFEQALVACVSVLVIACPCALGLAAPTALLAGTGAAARAGILVRDIEALESLAGADMIVFDKTGTLTLGEPGVVEIRPAQGDEAALVRLAAAVQQGNQHPLARGILADASERGIALPRAADFKVVPGEGVEGTVDGVSVLAGRPEFLAGRGIAIGDAQLADAAATPVAVARDGVFAGLIGLRDVARDSARDALAALAAGGLDTVMLTGDSQPVAEAMAREIGIGDFAARMTPEKKSLRIGKLRRAGHRVAMVGDGINDAPALAAADVGVAMGSGTDVAMETADIALMRSDLGLVPAARDIARRTLGKIRQNLFWAFVYNVVGIPLAAFGLLTPAIAGAAMAMSSVSVVSNSALLARWRPAAKARG